MAEVVHTTGAPARASIPLSADQPDITPDPAVVLIEMWERQIAAWRTLPEEAGDLRNAVADMSWSETAAAAPAHCTDHGGRCVAGIAACIGVRAPLSS